MSYILDALKKSEQERGHGNIPGVQTVHSSSLNYHNEKSTYWPYILITAVILNIAVILYFIFDKEQPITNPTESSQNTVIKNNHEENIANNNSAIDTDITEQTAMTTSTINKETVQDSIKPSPEATPSTANNQTTITTTTEEYTEANIIKPINTAVDNNTLEDNTEIIDFYNLPESIKQQLPTITVSAHVYSSNPLQRSIVINNKFIEEGEYVLDDLILHEITSNGAIFDYNGTLFSYSVVSSWQ